MANAVSTITIVHPNGVPPATVADRLLRRSAREPAEALSDLSGELSRLAGVGGHKTTVRVESSTPAAATGTVVCTAADATAGDTLEFFLPNGSIHVLTCVALNATVAADPDAGYWSLETATDTAVGDDVTDAINKMPGLREWVLASNSSGTVTVTARRLGTIGNSITMLDTETTSTCLVLTQMAGGVDHGTKPTGVVTCGTADIVADDDVTVGNVVLTWKASAAAEDEITLSTTEATAATNLAAVINAHSKLQGLITATVAAAIVTVTYEGPARAGALIGTSRTETNSGSVTWTAALLASGATEAYEIDPVTYAQGVV